MNLTTNNMSEHVSMALVRHISSLVALRLPIEPSELAKGHKVLARFPLRMTYGVRVHTDIIDSTARVLAIDLGQR